MKRGFTLIELLAVIVILAIIALIAVPIVIHIIDDSKKSSEKESIKLYLNHAQKMIAKEQMKEPTFNPEECKIKSDGILDCGEKELKIEMKGQMPKSGTIKFSKGMIVEGINIELDNLFYQVKDDKVSEGTKEKIILYSDYITKESDADHDGKVSSRDKYTYKVNDNNTFIFYVLSLNEDDTVNLIMDRNICEDGTEQTSNKRCTYAWHWQTQQLDEDDNNYGPDIAMTNLHNATKDWTNVPDMIMDYEDESNNGTNYGYTGITTENGITTITGKQNKTSTSQKIGRITEPLKARLPKLKEVTDLGCIEFSRQSCSTWLVENMHSSYWLLATKVGEFRTAFSVSRDYGTIGSLSVSYAGEAGLRPVITVSKSDLE